MGDFITNPVAPVLFTDKAAGPNVNRPPGWTDANTLKAVEANALRDALSDVRTAIRAREFNVQHYGAKGDGTTDDTAAIQAAINAATYTSRTGYVFLPAGRYRTTDTLHLGYGVPYGGNAFTSVRLVGAGRAYRGEDAFTGTAIVPTFSDRPCLNIQGGRQTRVEHLSLIGPNFDWTKSHALGNSVETLDASVRANWLAPSLAATADSRYAPCAGISIDAYAGARPGTSYPDVTYPAFLGAQAQWNKALSNIVTFDNVEVSGFVVGLVTEPSGGDGNGDFISVSDSAFAYNLIHLSISHTQCRNVQARNVRFDDCFIALTNNQHGLQSGQMDGHFSGCSFDRVQHLLEVGTNRSAPLVFSSCYAELLGRIGSVASSSPDNNPISFEGCHLRFCLETERTGPLDYVVASGPQPVSFRGCHLLVPRVFAYQGDVRFEETEVRHSASAADYGAAVADRLAINAHRGIFPTPVAASAVFPGPLRVKSRQYADVNNATVSAWLADLHALEFGNTPSVFSTMYGRNFGWPAWAPKTSRFGEWAGTNVARTYDRTALPLTSVTKAGIDFTLDFGANRAAGSLNEMLIGQGDLVLDPTTAARFFVVSAVGATVVLRLLNGYKKTGGVNATTVTLSANAGALYFLSSRVFTLPYPTFGDVTSGSGVITNVGRGDSFFGYATPAVGDYLLSHTSVFEVTGGRNLFFAPAKVTAVDTAARTITLNQVGLRTATLQPLTFWLRAP